MSRIVRKSNLLKVSVASDVLVSGGTVSITGLQKFRKNDILSTHQIKYKAEVVQVVTAGAGSFTPVGATKYTIRLYNPAFARQGVVENTQKDYSYTTKTDITQEGSTAALQREAIIGKIVTKINADNKNFVTALSSGGGTGFTITDAVGYYPARINGASNGRLGATIVIAVTNPDGSGWTAASSSVTTTAVYNFGEGQRLLDDKPVIASYIAGNLVSGELTAIQTIAGAFADAGQHYDAFSFQVYEPSDIPTIGSVLGFQLFEQFIFVDNGTGSSTTNLAGFVAFEREMLRLVFSKYETDASSTIDFFDAALTASATYPTTGAAITTTDNVVMEVGSARNQLYVNPIGTHTLLTPLVTTAGLTPYLDVTTQEGIELSVPNLTQNPKEFIVGKTEMSFYVRFTFGGIAATDWKSLSIGFRKKAAYAVDQTAYEAASVATACLGVPLDTGAAPVINIITGPGSAGALTNTSTTVTPTAASSHDIYVTVDINGVAHFYVNGSDKTGLLAASYTFTAGLHLMPFISFRHGANVSAAPAVVQMAALPSLMWRIS